MFQFPCYGQKYTLETTTFMSSIHSSGTFHRKGTYLICNLMLFQEEKSPFGGGKKHVFRAIYPIFRAFPACFPWQSGSAMRPVAQCLPGGQSRHGRAANAMLFRKKASSCGKQGFLALRRSLACLQKKPCLQCRQGFFRIGVHNFLNMCGYRPA